MRPFDFQIHKKFSLKVSLSPAPEAFWQASCPHLLDIERLHNCCRKATNEQKLAEMEQAKLTLAEAEAALIQKKAELAQRRPQNQQKRQRLLEEKREELEILQDNMRATKRMEVKKIVCRPCIAELCCSVLLKNFCFLQEEILLLYKNFKPAL